MAKVVYENKPRDSSMNPSPDIYFSECKNSRRDCSVLTYFPKCCYIQCYFEADCKCLCHRIGSPLAGLELLCLIYWTDLMYFVECCCRGSQCLSDTACYYFKYYCIGSWTLARCKTLCFCVLLMNKSSGRKCSLLNEIIWIYNWFK